MIDEEVDKTKAMTPADLAVVLRNLARAFESKDFGSPQVARSLIRLSVILRKHSSMDLNSLLDALGPTTRASTSAKSRRTREPDPGLSSLRLDQVRDILKQEVRRAELVELAVSRFGISGSRLMRESKEQIIAAIENAIHNEEALGILSEEAGREGARRSR